ncbi:MAG: excinuclease ABC subunit UvrC [Lentisphaeria bacterium]
MSSLLSSKSKMPIFRSQDVSRNPGVYVFRNNAGVVIYVGKARNLRNRMRSYFMPSTATKSDPRRRALIHSIASYETFEVSSESEALLLESQFIKQYNPRYNVVLRDDKRYLNVYVDLSVTYPRFEFGRIKKDDGRVYFGPFPHAADLRAAIRMLEIRYGIRNCVCAEPDQETRLHCMEHVIHDCAQPCVGKISPENYMERMEKAMSVLRGENEGLELLKELHEKMHEKALALLFEEAAALRDIIESLKTVIEPTRRFINQTIVRRQAVINEEGMKSLQKSLHLDSLPSHMECFDMSNISGTLAVGSMVCFRNGKPATNEYRRYRIRNEKAADDTAFMYEVILRRYSRVLREKQAFPSLIIVDGGLGQVHAAMAVLEKLGKSEVPLIGIAKEDELLVLPGRADFLKLPRTDPGLKMVQAIRDESHRFANGYHRELRNKRISDSMISEIPGIGAKKCIALLKTFGSAKNIAGKTATELANGLNGLGKITAEKILDYLKKHGL